MLINLITIFPSKLAVPPHAGTDSDMSVSTLSLHTCTMKSGWVAMNEPLSFFHLVYPAQPNLTVIICVRIYMKAKQF